MWGDTEWRQLSNGTVVNVPKCDDVAVVSVVFTDPHERPRDFTFVLGDRVVDHIEVDGVRFVRAVYRESVEVTD